MEWTIQLLQLQHAGRMRTCASTARCEALDELERRRLIDAPVPSYTQGVAHVPRPATAAICGAGVSIRPTFCLMTHTHSGGIAVYLGYDANRGQHFENDLLAVMP